MSTSDYRFVTHWRVKGPRELVYKILSEGKDYPKWWQPAYLACEEIAPKTIKATVRAKLPYTLTFTTQLIQEDPPEGFEIRSTGELDGTGHWHLRSDGDYAYVEFSWNVRANKPWMRRLSFVLKPLFVWNHNWVMKTGQVALEKEVHRQLNA